MSTAPRPPPRLPAAWWFVVICLFEFLLFDQVGARRITGLYPRWDDQVQYLSESYLAHERARAEGFGSALRHAILAPTAQGTLHDAAALVVFQIAGPSRSAALALNILALLAWQAALFAAASRLGRSSALAFAAALLPLALTGPWEIIPGSAYDFRLDHLAMCALGVTSALAVLTNDFRHRTASLAFGAAVGITLLTRFLTGTFLVLIFAGLAAWCLVQPDRRLRLANLALASLVAGALAGPILYLSRERILDYYWIGHFVGPESAVRAAHLNLPASCAFVFHHLGERHLGLVFGAAALLGVVLFRLARGSGPRPPASHWFLAALFVAAPALIFTLHAQKSEVVLSALVPGVVLFVLATWLAAGRPASSPGRRPALAAGAMALCCLVFFTQRQLRPAGDPATLAQLRQVNAVADELYRRVTTAPVAEPNLAIDHLNDALNAEVLRLIFYERHHRWLPIRMTLPTGVVAPADTDVRERLASSHFVLLTDEPAPAPRYPFDEKLAALRPQLRAWCDAHLRATTHLTVLGRTMTLYQRPDFPLAPARP